MSEGDRSRNELPLQRAVREYAEARPHVEHALEPRVGHHHKNAGKPSQDCGMETVFTAAIADGAGTRTGAEKASKTAVSAAHEYLTKTSEVGGLARRSEAEAVARVHEAFRLANEAVKKEQAQAVEKRSGEEGMATTLLLVEFFEDEETKEIKGVAGCVGDNFLLRVRGEEVETMADDSIIYRLQTEFGFKINDANGEEIVKVEDLRYAFDGVSIAIEKAKSGEKVNRLNEQSRFLFHLINNIFIEQQGDDKGDKKERPQPQDKKVKDFRRMLYRSVPYQNGAPRVSVFTVETGDWYVACTDGVRPNKEWLNERLVELRKRVEEGEITVAEAAERIADWGVEETWDDATVAIKAFNKSAKPAPKAPIII